MNASFQASLVNRHIRRFTGLVFRTIVPLALNDKNGMFSSQNVGRCDFCYSYRQFLQLSDMRVARNLGKMILAFRDFNFQNFISYSKMLSKLNVVGMHWWQILYHFNALQEYVFFYAKKCHIYSDVFGGFMDPSLRNQNGIDSGAESPESESIIFS